MKVEVNFPDWLYEELEKLAKIHSMSVGKYVSYLIERQLTGTSD